MAEITRYSQSNCGEQSFRNPDYRITEFEYNDYTYDLIIKQKPDVVKKVRIKSGVDLGDLAHLNPVVEILTDAESLPKSIIGAFPHVVKPETVNGAVKYYYFTWDAKFNKYRKLLLRNGHEFYNLEDGFKYRMSKEGLTKLDASVHLDITYTEDTAVIGNTKGKGISIKSATHTEAGLMSNIDKIRLDRAKAYMTGFEVKPKSPNVYLVYQTYDATTDKTTEKTYLLPEVTLAKKGLMTPEHKHVLENLIDTVVEINPEFTSNANGLTYVYITRNPETLKHRSHEITIPLVSKDTNGLVSPEQLQKLNDFEIVYENGEIKEIRFQGALLTSEKYEVSRDGKNYYIIGNDGTEILIESYDEVGGRAGLFNQEIYEKLRTYTNENKTPVTLGGIPSGSTFNKVPYPELLTKLLYPTIPPIIKRLDVEPLPGVYERGSNLQLTLIETEVYKKTYNIDNIEFLDNSNNLVYTYIESDKVVDNGGIFNYNIPTLIDTTKPELYYKVHVIDESGASSEMVSDKFTFVYAINYGVISENDTLDNKLVNNFEKIIELKGTKTLDLTANYQKVCIGYPKYYGELKGILDENGLNNINFFDLHEFQRSCSNYQLPYYFYISYMPITYEGRITIEFKN